MPLSDPTDILLAHDRWATKHLIEACASLTDEQFHQKFEMGCGSLHDSIAHILGAMRGWTDVLNGREGRTRLETGTYPREELFTLLDEVADEFASAVRANPLDGIATAERNGQKYTFVRGAILTHVATHSMHHRAQCLNMLRRLGVDPLPQNSVLQWMLAENTPG